MMARPPAKQFDYLDDDRTVNPFQSTPRMRRKPPKQNRATISRPRKKISVKVDLSLNKILQSKTLLFLLACFAGVGLYIYRQALSQALPAINLNLWVPLISVIAVAAIIIQHVQKSMTEHRFRSSLKQLGFRNFFEYDNAVLIREMNLGQEACTKIQREVINRLSRQNKAGMPSILEYEQTYANVAHELGINGAIWDQSIHGQSQVDTLKFLDQSRNLNPPKGFGRYLVSTSFFAASFLGYSYIDISPYWYIPVALAAILFIRDLLPGLMLVALTALFALLLLDLSKVVIFT